MKVGDKYFRVRGDRGIDIAIVVELGEFVGFKLYYGNKDHHVYMEWLLPNFKAKWTPTTPLMEALL